MDADEYRATLDESILGKDLVDIMVRGHANAQERVRARQAGEIVRPAWCICTDDWWMRGLDDPRCRHDEMEELHDTIACLKSVEDAEATEA
jgi:hypothetical protein